MSWSKLRSIFFRLRMNCLFLFLLFIYFFLAHTHHLVTSLRKKFAVVFVYFFMAHTFIIVFCSLSISAKTTIACLAHLTCIKASKHVASSCRFLLAKRLSCTYFSLKFCFFFTIGFLLRCSLNFNFISFCSLANFMLLALYHWRISSMTMACQEKYLREKKTVLNKIQTFKNAHARNIYDSFLVQSRIEFVTRGNHRVAVRGGDRNPQKCEDHTKAP